MDGKFVAKLIIFEEHGDDTTLDEHVIAEWTDDNKGVTEFAFTDPETQRRLYVSFNFQDFLTARRRFNES